MLPFQSGASRVSRLITVASGPVHLSDHPPLMTLGALAFWYGPAPVAVAVTGKLPGRLIGISRDLPSGVYWQWRRWCTTRGFHLGDVGKTLPVPDFKAFEGQARIVAIADDTMVPPAAVWRLMQLYPNAWRRQHVIRPDGDAIGHISVFHERNAKHWPEILGDVSGQMPIF
jgi:predicted alpha/beta hydrolase